MKDNRSDILAARMVELNTLLKNIGTTIKTFDASREIDDQDGYTKPALTRLTGKVANQVSEIERLVMQLDVKTDMLNHQIQEFKQANPTIEAKDKSMLEEANRLISHAMKHGAYAERCGATLKFLKEDLSAYDFVNPHQLKEDLKHDWSFYRYQTKRLKRL